MIRRIPEIEDDAVLVPCENLPGAVTFKRGFHPAVPVGTYVLKVFKVVGWDPDCDGSALAALAPVYLDRHGYSDNGLTEYEEQTEKYASSLRGEHMIDSPRDLDTLADRGDNESDFARLVGIHRMLDPAGTSCQSIEELIAALQAR